MKKISSISLYAAIFLLATSGFFLAHATGSLSDYTVRDEKVFHKGEELPDVVANMLDSPTPAQKIYSWVVIDTGNSEEEINQVAYFFDKNGKNILAIPLEGDGTYTGVLVDPRGQCLLLADGGLGLIKEITLYRFSDPKPVATFTAFDLGYVLWVDADNFIMTRVDDMIWDVRPHFPLCSVVLFNVVTLKATVLKQSDDTHSYDAPELSDDKKTLTISESWVNKREDWTEDGKAQSKTYTMTLP